MSHSIIANRQYPLYTQIAESASYRTVSPRQTICDDNLNPKHGPEINESLCDWTVGWIQVFNQKVLSEKIL